MNRKERIHNLLKSIETGNPEPLSVINEKQYVQHNPQTREGSVGLAALFKQLAQTAPRVNIVRLFEDPPFVFAHTEYDFSSRKIGFEVFRFDGEQAVEHWDNIQERQGPDHSGCSMVDGPTMASDLDRTEPNRRSVSEYLQTVMIDGQTDQIGRYVNADFYREHNPSRENGLPGLRSALDQTFDGGRLIHYRRVHRVLAEGDFVLSMSEGTLRGEESAFFDLFRLENGRISEHWDTIERIAPPSEWKNRNGKF